MKKIISILLAGLVMSSSLGVLAENTPDNNQNTSELTNKIYEKRNWAKSGIKVAVNGNEISFPDQEPLLDADLERTYVPVRFLAEALGAEIDWDDAHKVVIIKNYGIDGKDTLNIHYLRLGENKLVIRAYYPDLSIPGNVNQKGAQATISYYFPDDIYPVIVNDRTMLPFRYVAELLGAQVYYDPTAGVAHCVKRDLSSYEYGRTGNASHPIFNTVLGDYFADELNKWYADPDNEWSAMMRGNSTKPIEPNYFDSALGDATTWAGMDHLTHPEWHEEDGHGHSKTAHKFTGNLENEVGCYAPFYRTYLPNEEIYQPKRWEWQDDHFIRGSYRENQVQYGSIRFARKNYDRSLAEYNELVKNWGLELDRDSIGLTNMEELERGTSNIYVFDESTYRNIAAALIGIWASSPGHLEGLLIEGRAVGVSIVGDNAYYITFKQ